MNASKQTFFILVSVILVSIRATWTLSVSLVCKISSPGPPAQSSHIVDPKQPQVGFIVSASTCLANCETNSEPSLPKYECRGYEGRTLMWCSFYLNHSTQQKNYRSWGGCRVLHTNHPCACGYCWHSSVSKESSALEIRCRDKKVCIGIVHVLPSLSPFLLQGSHTSWRTYGKLENRSNVLKL